MGRVLPYEDIELGRYPDERMFGIATETFQTLATIGVEEGTISGAFIFGSAAIGRAGPRSDFDAFIMLPVPNVESYRRALNLIRIVAEETLQIIPIQPIIQTEDALALGNHEMDKFFCEHLKGNHRVVVGEDPAPKIHYSAKPGKDIFAEYLAHKKRRISSDYTKYTLEQVREGQSLQRMLELAVAIGRKSVQAGYEVHWVDEGVENTADKTQVINAARGLFKLFDLDEGFEDAVSMDIQYQRILEDTMKGNLDKGTYENLLVELHHQLPHGLIWIDQIEQIMLPRL